VKYPIDIETIAAECNAMYPKNTVIEPILRAVLPMVNEAYEQGRSEAASFAQPYTPPAGLQPHTKILP